jgi:hypothetical protein
MAKSASTLSQAELQDKSNAYFRALINHPEATIDPIQATYSASNATQLVLTASGRVDLTLSNVFRLIGLNFTQLNVGTSSTIKWGTDRLRVALVLDTTGSMASAGKIDALKTATKNLLDQLRAASQTDGDVLVSIIPFSKDVNVGSSGNGTASWLQFDDTTDNSWDGANGTCNKSGATPRSVCLAQNSCSLSGYTSPGSCTSAGTCSNPGQTSQNSCTSQNACTKSRYSDQNDCEDHRGTWGRGTWTAGAWVPPVWTPDDHSTWNGCITDRGNATDPGTRAGNDQTVTTPTAGDATTLFYPEQYGSCSPQMKGLSSEWDSMKTLVDSLYAAGTTNQPIGLVWGWQSLVGGGPLTMPAKSTTYTYKETIILLSDGMNTQNRWNGDGSHTSTEVDSRMYISSGAGTCDNIKTNGHVTIYTIQVNTATGSRADPESAVLRNCASTGKFKMITVASEIGTVFTQIGKELSQLRVAM